MKLKNFLFPMLLVGSAAGLICRTMSKSASATPIPRDASFEAIDTYVEGQMRRLHIPGVSLAIVEGDHMVHFRGFGRAHPGGEAPTILTPFFIGSVTKSFTALAIMQLVEAGKIELDAPIQRYLPWFRVADPEASAQMTVRHLLNHTSGLSARQGQEILSDLDNSPGASERQLRALSSYKPAQPVGSKFMYNNTNYNLLGAIIEAASGETYPDYIQQNIFNPLGMKRSYSSKALAQQNGLAMGHRYWFGVPVPTPDLPQPMGSLPSGQLISCAEDMTHYLIAQLNGGRFGDAQVLSRAGIDEMHRGTAKIIEMGFDMGSYAMGWESMVVGNSTIVSHSGIVPEFGAFAGLIPEQKKGFILLFNVNHAIAKMTFDELGLGLAERLAGELPSKTYFSLTPWLMHSMALIPILQVADVVSTLSRIRCWHRNPDCRPSNTQVWWRHILLPLVPNLLVALSLAPMLSKMRDWVKLFMPDFSWIARINGGFAAIWVFVRTGLMLNFLRKTLPK